ncbi:hypothetical protein [Elizabethkingia meningoseptica]|uniref:hypothetical protein n=1 Tax=Elizabethkingia meningoseptica TaxID=238 RepID=UPI0023B1F008|nr:hypothetical protein [Elizabethkingia meningoseptica]MDE5492234.1 hypothetical protein [Elizabethkingia meningoseptica]
MNDSQKRYLQALQEEEKEELEKHSSQISSFKEFMKKKGVELTDSNFNFHRTTGVIASYPNIVGFLHENLVNDKEGLMSFSDLCKNFTKKSFMNGYLYGENFMLMANSYFRRGFHEVNNYAPRFIELFWNFTDDDIDAYISLDMDRVRINVNDLAYMEFDTWYGAQFNSKIDLIPDGLVKLRPPMDFEPFYISTFFNNVYSLDIKWATKDNIKSFQAEEFKTEEIKIEKNGIEYYPVRYIHAEYDIEKGYFRHFDGAIHFYTESEYYSRRDSDFNYNNKNQGHIKTLSQKLFKMNGIVDVNTWTKYSSHFFMGNPLVFEYFEGKYPDKINEILEKIRLTDE